MANRERSDFERCALSSGLVTARQIDQAMARVSWTWDSHGTSDDSHNQRQLAERLVELGVLNTWQAKQLLEGQDDFHLGPYHIIDSLGRGGMGHVYLARHGVLGREVAVKVLPRERSTPEAIESFIREIRAQARLSHENLVQAFDAGYHKNVYYLVSEYVRGVDLRKLVRRTGPMDMQMAASIVSQVAKGLEHAHEQGLIHRDIKPGNVLVTPNGHAKLSDLGLAGSLVADPRTDPQFGKIVGTADYLSPDHIRTPWAPTPTWDIYSLGCTLYFAVTSKVPFPGGSTADKCRAHCQVHPLDPRLLNPTLSVEFVDALADMMAKNPSERIDTAAEVVDRLAPWVGQPRPIPEAVRGRVVPAAKVFASTSRRRSIPPDTEDPGDTQDILPEEADEFSELWPDERSQQSQLTQSLKASDQETRPWLSPEGVEPRLPKPRRVALPLLMLVGLPVLLILLLVGILMLTGLVLG